MTSSPEQPILEIRDLDFTFHDERGPLRALEQISFRIRPQQFVCLVGPSGSGKSTLLRILAGLLPPGRGEVIYHGTPMDSPRKGMGIMFQDANLMPWRTVLQNITLPLEISGITREEAEKRAGELIELVGLTGFDNYFPRDLSGGMAQRVAIARALVNEPDLLLLDEPFGALDALTRERMGAELLRIWRVHRKTVVMVTHDISEAVFLADRVLVISPLPGKLRLNLKVPISRPRKEKDRYTPEFASLTRKIRKALQ